VSRPAPYRAPSIAAAVSSGTSGANRTSCQSGAPARSELGQASAVLREGGVQAGPGGDRGGLPVGDAAVVDLGQAGGAGLADPVERRREGARVGRGDRAGVPPGGPGGEGLGGGLPGLQQAGGGGLGGGLLTLLDGLLAGQFLVGVGALGAGVADGGQEPADLADVIPAGRHAGTGGREQVCLRVAGGSRVNRAEAVVGDA
jgi:hypothetical protein